MPTSSTGRAGFTLVELIVVIVIITVLATMIVPHLTGAANLTRMREAAQSLALSAGYARDYAVTRRCCCRLMIDPQENRYALACQKDPEHDPGEFGPLPTGLGKPTSLAQPLAFARIRIELRRPEQERRSAEHAIEFGPLGRADAAIVQITDGRRTFSLTVAPSTGQARVVASAVEELPNDRFDIDAQ